MDSVIHADDATIMAWLMWAMPSILGLNMATMSSPMTNPIATGLSPFGPTPN